MLTFKEFLVKKNEANYDPFQNRNLDPLQNWQSLQQNKDFSLPTAGMKTAGKLTNVGLRTAGKLAGTIPAIAGGLGAMAGVRSRFKSAQKYVLQYLKNNPRLREGVLDKVEEALALIDRSEKKVAMVGTLGQVSMAIWRGAMASVRNLFDTWLGRSGGDSDFQKQFEEMLNLLGQMPKEIAFPSLKQFEHLLSMGGTAAEADVDAL